MRGRRSRELRQMRSVRGQQIVGQPPRDGRIAHGAVGQQRFDEERPAARQRGLDGQFHRGELANERRGQGGAVPLISYPLTCHEKHRSRAV